MSIPVKKEIQRTNTFIDQEYANRGKTVLFYKKGKGSKVDLYQIGQTFCVCQLPTIYRVLNYLP